MKVRLTKRTIETAKPSGTGATYLWDKSLPSFALRIYPSGRRSFVVTYRVLGKQRFYTLGPYGPLSLEEARTEAMEVLARARRGEDPSGERRKKNSSPTMADLAERYMTEHAEVHKKPGSIRNDRRNWAKEILPRLGKRKVAEIDRDDIARIHQEMASTPVLANSVRGLLSKSFNLAEVWGWRPEGTNPCRHVKRYKEKARERYLTADELARLGKVLNQAEASWGWAPQAIAAIRLLLLTGCRCSEILKLRWEHVDLAQGRLNLPDSKTGPKTVRLNAGAVEILRGLERVEGSPWVVPGKDPKKPRHRIEDLWSKIRRQAGIEDVRIHDLRHTFASEAISSGVSLPVIGKLLGHSNVATTERYAHLADDPIREANEAIGASLAATLAGSAQDDGESGESAAA